MSEAKGSTVFVYLVTENGGLVLLGHYYSNTKAALATGISRPPVTKYLESG
jgi:hypothetical protein